MKTRPKITELNSKVNLLSTKTLDGVQISEVTIKTIAIRPFIKKINFLTKEFGIVNVYSGDVDFEAHKDDSQQDLIAAFLNKINTDL